MKILFWNIGKDLQPIQYQLLESLILEISPDIVCIAEGTESVDKCKTLVSKIEIMGFDSYYNPLFGKKLSFKFGYKNVGLKVFTKSSLNIKSATLKNIAEKGRIINFETNTYNIFFIHALSMLNEDFDVGDFYKDLYDRLISQINVKKTIIIGDFNIEPWHSLLQRRKKIHSLFYKKAMMFFQKRITENPRRRVDEFYYNPFLEYIQDHQNELLVGTYYNHNSNDYPVSLLDFILLSNTILNEDYQIEIVTTIQNKPMLIRTKGNTSIINGFDHLPIVLDIK